MKDDEARKLKNSALIRMGLVIILVILIVKFL